MTAQELPDLGAIGAFVPSGLRDAVDGRAAEGGASGSDWLRSLPRLVRECAQQWSLTASGAIHHGACALVLACERDGAPIMLKVTWPHLEAAHEHLALRAWDGEGAVRLLAADPARWALLLEPLHADDSLASIAVDASCAVLGSLLAHLDRPALPQLTRLSTQAQRWAEALTAQGSTALPRRVAERAAAILRSYQHPDADLRLVHTDLHDANVLAADRAPWPAIDPKPLAAVPELGIAPLVWNRWHEAAAAPSARQHLRRRVEIACDSGGLDGDRARDLTFVRCALNAVWEAQMPRPDTNWISVNITICKAMQG